MANEIIILQIFFITIAVNGFSLIFNKIFGLTGAAMKEFQQNAMNLQERMQNAQVMQDPQMLQQLQKETTELMKTMMIKQLIPMTLRCAVFFGLWAVLGIVYADYTTGLLPFPVLIFGDGWFGVYFLFSLSLSLVIMAIRMIYKKITGKGSKRQNLTQELMGIMTPAQSGGAGLFNLQHPSPQIPSQIEPSNSSSSEQASWKQKIDSSKLSRVVIDEEDQDNETPE